MSVTNEFEIITLNNGIRVVYQQVNSPISHACVIIGAGSRDEPKNRYGMAHFIEHLLFKKTRRRNTSQIINWLESVGADLNAYTTKEYTCLHASFLKPYLARALDLFEDLLFHSEFPEEELKKEKSIILDEIASYRDSPEDAIMDDFEDLVFKGHGLGHNILGLEADLSSFDLSAVREFMDQNYAPDRTVIGISGQYSPREVLRKVEKYYGHLLTRKSDGIKQADFLAHTPIAEQKLLPINQVHYMMGSVAYSLHDQNKVGLLLLNNLIGGMGMGSRLNMNIREKHGIAYTIESNYHAYADTGLFSVYFGTEEDKYEKALQLIWKEFKKLRARKLGESTLYQAKKKFKGQIALGEESRMSLLIGQAKSLLDYGHVQTLSHVFEQIDLVDSSQILEIANQILDPDRFFSLAFMPE
ncbi:MAG TPA: pitrilysin family protein [Sphingobacteriaceae bacterium]|nr:pitrilysin family protein [Sphingobacteriaceae bacterium]